MTQLTQQTLPEFKIGVVIPTFNRRDYLEVLLNQLAQQVVQSNIKIMPLVVIDGATDGTREMLATRHHSVTYIEGSGNWWWTKSVNEGIEAAIAKFHPEYILLLNDDSQIEPNYVQTLCTTFSKVESNAVLGSISVTDSKPPKVSFSGVKKIDWVTLKTIKYYKSFDYLTNLPSDLILPTCALNGRGIFTKATTFQHLNYLDAKAFPQYGSDDDFAQRAIKKQYPVYISLACKVIDRTTETSQGSALRQDKVMVFVKSFFRWNSVNYILKQIRYYSRHGIKLLLPFYIVKFILGTSYAYFYKYNRMKHEL